MEIGKCHFKVVVVCILIGVISARNAEGFGMKLSDFFGKEVASLIKAIEGNDEKMAQGLIDQGVSLNVRGAEGMTPLFWLIMNKNKEGMRTALQLGADPNLSDFSGDSPVSMVSGADDDEYLIILLEAGGNPDSFNRNGAPAIFEAIDEDRLDQIKIFQKFGVNLNLTNKSGDNSALHSAMLAKYDIVYYLIKNGADFTARNESDGYVAWVLHDHLINNLLNPEGVSYSWAIKTKQELIAKGVEFPPPSPREIRWAEGRPNRFDIDAKNRELSEKL